MQQQRHPGLSEEEGIHHANSAPAVEAGGDDDNDAVADKQAIDRVRGLNAVSRAYAINEGSDRGDDLLPSF